MKKRIGIIISITCVILNTVCYAQEYHADCNIIQKEDNNQQWYMYNGLKLYYDTSEINNIWWTGKEYIYRDIFNRGLYKKSEDMLNWENMQETDGLDRITTLSTYTYDIHYWGGKYIVYNRLYEGGGDLTASVDRGLTIALRPVLVLDDNFNIINEVTFDDPITAVSYVDGKYYIRTQDYTNYKETGNPNNTIYTSSDAVTWIVDESLTEVPLGNVNGFKLIQDGSLQNGEMPYVYNIKEVTKDSINNIISRKSIVYEEGILNGLKTDNNMFISFDDYSDEPSNKFKFSLDGVYWLDVPYPEYLRLCDIYPDMQSTDYTEHVYNYIDLNDKILFQTQYRLFEYDKNELAETWYNTFGNTQTYVELNDILLGFETAPVIENDYMLVPMRFLFEQMGAEVEWDQETQTATATMDNTKVSFSINDINAEVDGENATMDVPARLINEKTMVPLRFLSEKMGYTVTWEEATRTAVIE